jgi:hypothetical protein
LKIIRLGIFWRKGVVEKFVGYWREVINVDRGAIVSKCKNIILFLIDMEAIWIISGYVEAL